MLFAVSHIVYISFVPSCSHLTSSRSHWPRQPFAGSQSGFALQKQPWTSAAHVLGDFLVLSFRFGLQAVVWRPESDLARLGALTLHTHHS